MRIPAIMAMDKWVALGIIRKASGMRCMNASPKRAPTAKLTRRKIYFLRSCSLSERVKTPSKDIKLTIMTLTNAYRETENILFIFGCNCNQFGNKSKLPTKNFQRWEFFAVSF